MNIDTLNAYCGIELVSVPYPAQGRFTICQMIVFVCSGPLFCLWQSVALRFVVRISQTRLLGEILGCCQWPCVHGAGLTSFQSVEAPLLSLST